MNASPNLMTTLTAQLMLMLQLGVGIAVLTVAIMRWPQVRTGYKPGLLLGGLVFVLSLPNLVATSLHFEATALMPSVQDPQVAQITTVIMRVVMAVAALGMMVATVFFTPLQLSVGELALADGRRAYPWLLDGRRDTRGWALAAGAGAAMGLVSGLAFWSLGVGEGPAIELVKRLFPALDFSNPSVLLGLTLPAVLVAAVSEELLFRGLIQAWLTRWLGGTSRAMVLAVLASSALWALAHWGNTDQPWLKLGQIFLIGLALGALVRRYSVEASIIAHVALNVVSVLLALALPD